MSAYRDALAIDAFASDERLALAAEILATRRGIVMFEGLIALRPTHTHLMCEVVDRMAASRRCANEYEVLVENAQRALDASKLGNLLPNLPRKWSVVGDSETGTAELWHAPL